MGCSSSKSTIGADKKDERPLQLIESKKSHRSIFSFAIPQKEDNESDIDEGDNVWRDNEGESVSSNSNQLHVYKRIKNQFKVRPDVLQKYVDKILADKDLNIAWLPDILERKIYEFAIMSAMGSAYDEMFKYHGREVCGHHFELELVTTTDIPDPPRGKINRENLSIIVNKLIDSPLIEMKWLPQSIKQQLFFNILLLMLTVMHITCTSSECDILGHRIAATFTAKMQTCEKSHVEHSAIDATCLKTFIDNHLADPEKNVAWLPDNIESSLLTTISVLTLTVIEEVFHDFRVNLMSDQIRFRLVPGPAPKLEDLIDFEGMDVHKLEKAKAACLEKVQHIDKLIEVAKNVNSGGGRGGGGGGGGSSGSNSSPENKPPQAAAATATDAAVAGGVLLPGNGVQLPIPPTPPPSTNSARKLS